LNELAAEIGASCGIEVRVFATDLGRSEGAQRVLSYLRDHSLDIDFLVNNAGAGNFRSFLDISADTLSAHTTMNVVTLQGLTRGLLPSMVSRGRGTVINIGSSVGYMSLPYAAAYAASKAFVISFTEALWAELRHTGVRILVVNPGPTENSDTSRSFPGMRTPQQVVETTFQALAKDIPAVIDGAEGKKQSLFPRLLPRRLAVLLAGRMNKKNLR
jgi:short-subunit dehydrogenase